MLEPPKLTLRANTLKTSANELLSVLKGYGFEVEKCKYSPNGLRFLKRPVESLFKLPEFKRGHFEL